MTPHPFPRDKRGAIAVEFALILPVMVIMLLGATSATDLARASIKSWNAAQSIADMVSQQASLSTAEMTDFCTGGRLALAPLSGTATFTAASVTTSASGTTAVDWQDTASCGGQTMTDALSVAKPYVPNAKDSAIVVRITYVHTFPPSYVLPRTLTLTRTGVSRPRAGTTVAHG
jgi:Flp pilus assembly protein TadG